MTEDKKPPENSNSSQDSSDINSLFGDNDSRAISQTSIKTSSLQLERVEDEEPHFSIPGLSEQYIPSDISTDTAPSIEELPAVTSVAEEENAKLEAVSISNEEDQVQLIRESLISGPIVMGVQTKKINVIKKSLIVWSIALFIGFSAGGFATWLYANHKLSNVAQIVSQRAIYENTGALLKDVKKINSLIKQEKSIRNQIMWYGFAMWILVGSITFILSLKFIDKKL